MEAYEYKWLPGPMVPRELLDQLASLYSEHYGIWSEASATNPGGRIRLSTKRIGELLASNEARIAYATLHGSVVGYAIAVQVKVPDYGVVSWVTQLVVHADHRRKDVGKSLLFSIWTFTDHFAWGLLTANPYAIRALEKATRRRCEPKRIARNKRKLRTVALGHVPYVRKDTNFEINKNEAKIDTQFPIDHSTLGRMLSDVTTPNVPWLMGQIEEGWEWFAFTFQDQEEIGLAPEEIEAMLKTSDHVAQRAYARMLLNKDHLWAQHGKPEAEFIASICDLKPGVSSVLDCGCGTGRHVLELAAMGVDARGIDYLDNLIDRARQYAASRNLSLAAFEVGDFRDADLGAKFDVVLCLYDVIGSYADETQNIRIAKNVTRHLKPGGTALISVMNLELTERKAKHFFSLAKEPNKLLTLKPSRTMEQTGDIFDPEYYMLDRETNIVYRKEQFAAGSSLPMELIVRDRRYRKDDIEQLCRDAGLEVVWSRFVRAGRWDPLERDSDRAKEILLCCKRSSA
jgi:2-polyprenyl-3-methyl-5-hydroxy-6-metoxy-1,4-benzoquinol methylase/GNAT superfamily N-acetyltransferase